MKIDIRSFQCVDETGGGLEVGKDETVFCIAVFGVGLGGTYSEYRRFDFRLGTGLDDGDQHRFSEPIEFFARSREDGRPSYPLHHLEFHVAAFELEGREDTETAARRVYERWLVALLEAFPEGRSTPWRRRRDQEEGATPEPASWLINVDAGTAADGLRIADNVKGGHQLVIVDAWRLDLINDPLGDTFSAPGVGQTDDLYIGPVFYNVTRNGHPIQRWRNDERTSELRRYSNHEASSTYTFYVNYWA